MLRLIVRTQDRIGAVHVGGGTDTSFKTFDVEAPEVEAFLTENFGGGPVDREVVGVEVIPAPSPAQEELP